MLIAAIALPAILGGVTLLLQDPEDRPKGTALVQQLVRGYALVPTLAVTIVVLAVAGTIRKLDSVVHRREDAHVAMVVRPGRYDALVDTLEETLTAGELITTRGEGPSILTVPARILARVAGQGIGRLVPDKLVELRGPTVKVADLSLGHGGDRDARCRAEGARPRRSRRLVARRVVHDDEGGAEGRGPPCSARIGRRRDDRAGAAGDRPAAARPQGRRGHLRGAVPAAPAAGRAARVRPARARRAAAFASATRDASALARVAGRPGRRSVDHRRPRRDACSSGADGAAGRATGATDAERVT